MHRAHAPRWTRACSATRNYGKGRRNGNCWKTPSRTGQGDGALPLLAEQVAAIASLAERATPQFEVSGTPRRG
ncbi:hypothetical protein XFF6991_570232 [Xanthomonas phaseoli pv. phaseoli]|uniref:Uncharacterized protein n=1 Tax=Xanthomonas campestris pv. phaseoli TaxID=317013 RepID=A0A7Z7J3I1_XANCH|nr:hypothetical protein XFF6991_570232 [Xanthomonas phaseoli pv. phaseoli]